MARSRRARWRASAGTLRAAAAAAERPGLQGVSGPGGAAPGGAWWVGVVVGAGAAREEDAGDRATVALDGSLEGLFQLLDARQALRGERQRQQQEGGQAQGAGKVAHGWSPAGEGERFLRFTARRRAFPV